MDAIFFLLFAAIALACAVNLVLQKHPISSALSLIGVMGSLAVLYLLLGGEFLAAVQIIVYAGAIMVLFVFVIMLLNAGREARKTRALVASLAAVPLALTFLWIMVSMVWRLPAGAVPVRFGEFAAGAREIGHGLFGPYLLPFELTSILVLVAIIGAIVLARKELD